RCYVRLAATGQCESARFLASTGDSNCSAHRDPKWEGKDLHAGLARVGQPRSLGCDAFTGSERWSDPTTADPGAAMVGAEPARAAQLSASRLAERRFGVLVADRQLRHGKRACGHQESCSQ